MNIGILIIETALILVYTAASVLYYKKREEITSISLLISIPVALGIYIVLQCIYGSLNINNIIYLSAGALCFPLAWIDKKEKKIPNKVLIIGLIIRVILFVPEIFLADEFILLEFLKNYGFALIIIVVFCGIGLAVFRDGIGLGDVKLLLVLALFLGARYVFSSLFFSLFAAFLVALFLLIFKKADKKSSIAFAPLILFGTYITIVLAAVE